MITAKSFNTAKSFDKCENNTRERKGNDEDLEIALRRYRANPTDARFEAVYRLSKPWLRSVALSTLRKFPTLPVDTYVDDLVNDGALAISRSARRFCYFCECGELFLHRSDLIRHMRDDHKLRGGAAAVTLRNFSQYSARLAMRSTAIRSIQRSADIEPNEGIDERFEPDVICYLLVVAVGRRLSEQARELVKRILEGDEVELGEALEELRSEFASLRE